MVAPDLRHPRRSQAEIPLIDLSEFGQPPLSSVSFATNMPSFNARLRSLHSLARSFILQSLPMDVACLDWSERDASMFSLARPAQD
jgi:hypothetical protein